MTDNKGDEDKDDFLFYIHQLPAIYYHSYHPQSHHLRQSWATLDRRRDIELENAYVRYIDARFHALHHNRLQDAEDLRRGYELQEQWIRNRHAQERAEALNQFARQYPLRDPPRPHYERFLRDAASNRQVMERQAAAIEQDLLQLAPPDEEDLQSLVESEDQKEQVSWSDSFEEKEDPDFED